MTYNVLSGTLSIYSTRKNGMVLFSVLSVCLPVCLFWLLDALTCKVHFGRATQHVYLQNIYIMVGYQGHRVNGTRSRSRVKVKVTVIRA